MAKLNDSFGAILFLTKDEIAVRILNKIIKRPRVIQFF
jgi:hypothetical protein